MDAENLIPNAPTNTALNNPLKPRPLGLSGSSRGKAPSGKPTTSSTGLRPKRLALGDITNRTSSNASSNTAHETGNAKTIGQPTASFRKVSTATTTTMSKNPLASGSVFSRRRVTSTRRTIPRHPDGSVLTPEHVPLPALRVFESPVLDLDDVELVIPSTSNTDSPTELFPSRRRRAATGRSTDSDYPTPPSNKATMDSFEPAHTPFSIDGDFNDVPKFSLDLLLGPDDDSLLL